MSDHLKELRLFARVVERASFTAVARESGLSQPSVSRQIAALEDRVGARLLFRSTRSVKATEAGLLLYERAKKALDDLSDAEAEVKAAVSGHEGRLRVAASLAFGSHFVVPAARAFLARFPKVRLELFINDRYVDLVEEGIDVAIRLGTLRDSTYGVRTLGREELTIAASAGYLRAHGRPKTIADLAKHQAVVLVRDGAASRWKMTTPEGERTIVLDGALHVDNIVAVHHAVREGLGIGVLPTYLTGDLVRVLPNVTPVGLPVHAVFPAARRLSAKVHSFIDHLAPLIPK